MNFESNYFQAKSSYKLKSQFHIITNLQNVNIVASFGQKNALPCQTEITNTGCQRKIHLMSMLASKRLVHACIKMKGYKLIGKLSKNISKE